MPDRAPVPAPRGARPGRWQRRPAGVAGARRPVAGDCGRPGRAAAVRRRPTRSTTSTPRSRRATARSTSAPRRTAASARWASTTSRGRSSAIRDDRPARRPRRSSTSRPQRGAQPGRRRVRRLQGRLARGARATGPSLFGKHFTLIPAGNRYGLPDFYELHAWIWRRTRAACSRTGTRASPAAATAIPPSASSTLPTRNDRPVAPTGRSSPLPSPAVLISFTDQGEDGRAHELIRLDSPALGEARRRPAR